MSESVTLTIALDAQQAQAALAALTGNLDKAKEKSQGVGESLAEAASALKEGIGAAIEVAQKVGQAVLDLAHAAAEHERTARALSILGTAYAQVQAATNDTVSAQQALAVQQSLVQSGLRVTGDQLATITRRAREFALQTGGDTTQAVEQLTDALRGGEAEGLRKFGLTADTTRSRVQNFESAIAQMNSELHRTKPAARTMAEELERTSRSWEEFKTSMAGALSQAIGLQEIFGKLTQALKNLSAAAAADRAAGRSPLERHLGNIAELGASIANPLFSTLLGPEARSQVEQLQQGQGILGSSALGQAARLGLHDALTVAPTPIPGSSGTGVAEPSRLVNTPGSPASSGIATLRAQVRELEEQARAAGALWRAADTAGARSEPELKRRTESLREAIRTTQDFAAVQAAEWQRQEEATARNREATDAYIAQQSAQAEAKRAAAAAELEALAAVMEQERQLAEQRANSLSLSHQFAQSFGQIADVTQTGSQALAKTATSAFGTLTGALRQHVRAVIEGKESIGDALKATLHETLATLATEAAVQAIFQTASGFARIAIGDYPGAANSFIAAGLFAGTAALAGVGAAVTAPSAPQAASASSGGSSAGPAARAGSTPGSSNAGGGSTTIVYQIAGNVFGRERGEEEIAAYTRGARDRGLI